MCHSADQFAVLQYWTARHSLYYAARRGEQGRVGHGHQQAASALGPGDLDRVLTHLAARNVCEYGRGAVFDLLICGDPARQSRKAAAVSPFRRCPLGVFCVTQPRRALVSKAPCSSPARPFSPFSTSETVALVIKPSPRGSSTPVSASLMLWPSAPKRPVAGRKT